MNELSLLTIISAAVVDAFNPCAIGVMIFLVTFLTAVSTNKKRFVAVGITYIFVVYLCYLGAGLGLLKLLIQLDFIKYIYKIAGVAILIGGIVDIYDGITKNPKPLLSIPSKASPKIKKYIKKSTIPAAIILGALVSLFELPCTGGVYIAILSLLSKQGLSLQTFGYLALYNFIFVLPLLIILLLSLFGFSIIKIDEWKDKNKTGMRILTGVGMIILAIVVLFL